MFRSHQVHQDTVASKTCSQRKSFKVLGRKIQAHNQQQPATLRAKTSHTSEIAAGDPGKDSPRTPRDSAMSFMSICICLVARFIQSNGKVCESCPTCMKNSPPPVQPLLQSELPSHPWERVAADLFQLNNTVYLLVVDYFSRFMEVQKLTSTTSSSVISALKAIIFTSWDTI